MRNTYSLKPAYPLSLLNVAGSYRLDLSKKVYYKMQNYCNKIKLNTILLYRFSRIVSLNSFFQTVHRTWLGFHTLDAHMSDLGQVLWAVGTGYTETWHPLRGLLAQGEYHPCKTRIPHCTYCFKTGHMKHIMPT